MVELTPTGDDEMKLQYKEFNNTSVGDYPVGNYDGAVVHGQYCSIGIENNDGTGGLEYTYNNNYPIQCMPMSDQRALFITTKGASLYAQPELLISNESLSYDIELNQSASQDLILENIGEDGSILSYEINISPFVGITNPAIILKVVVLPQPEGPNIEKNSPA